MAQHKAEVADDVAAEIDAQNAERLAEVAQEVEQHRQDETIPGGVYGDADGRGYHDAEGNPVTKDGKPKKVDA